MKKFIVGMCAVVALVVSSLAVHAEDCSCSGVSSALPTWVDPMTPGNALPCFTGAPTPEGYAGAIPYYDYRGELSWISAGGHLLAVTGETSVIVSDTGRVDMWGSWAGFSTAEKVLLLQNAVRAKGRALSVFEVLN